MHSAWTENGTGPSHILRRDGTELLLAELCGPEFEATPHSHTKSQSPARPHKANSSQASTAGAATTTSSNTGPEMDLTAFADQACSLSWEGIGSGVAGRSSKARRGDLPSVDFPALLPISSGFQLRALQGCCGFEFGEASGNSFGFKAAKFRVTGRQAQDTAGDLRDALTLPSTPPQRTRPTTRPPARPRLTSVCRSETSECLARESVVQGRLEDLCRPHSPQPAQHTRKDRQTEHHITSRHVTSHHTCALHSRGTREKAPAPSLMVKSDAASNANHRRIPGLGRIFSVRRLAFRFWRLQGGFNVEAPGTRRVS